MTLPLACTCSFLVVSSPRREPSVYVWANKLPKGEHVTSPFTPNIITVAEDSGEELAGRWTSHQRNIYDDYRRFFGEEPPKVGGVAVMTDSDNKR